MSTKEYLGFAVGLILSFVSTSSFSEDFYISIEGSRQGAFKGQSLRYGQNNEWTAGIAFEHQVQSPRDVATGRATGKRQHTPLAITKEWGAASPQIMYALVTNEMLPRVVMEFVHTNDSGVEEVYYKVTLTNATVSNVISKKTLVEDVVAAKTGKRYSSVEVETVEFVYQQIEWESLDGGTIAADDWVSAR